MLVQRGQDAHSHEQGCVGIAEAARLLDGSRHHRRTSANVEGQHPHMLAGGLPNGKGDRVRDIVELEVEENARRARVLQLADDIEAVGQRQPVADLESPDVPREPPDDAQRFVDVACIERADDLAVHGPTS
jgi:hypothetical protein